METFLKGPTSSLPAERCITLADLPSVTTLLQKIGEEIYDKKLWWYNIHHHGDYNMYVWLSQLLLGV